MHQPNTSTYSALSFLTKLRNEKITPYTSLASSSIDITLPAANPLGCVCKSRSSPLRVMDDDAGPPPPAVVPVPLAPLLWSKADDPGLENLEDEVVRPPKRLLLPMVVVLCPV